MFFVQELVGGPGLSGTRPQRRKKERKDKKKIKRRKNVNGDERDAQWSFESLNHYSQNSLPYGLLYLDDPFLSQILCKVPHHITAFVGKLAQSQRHPTPPHNLLIILCSKYTFPCLVHMAHSLTCI